ncbi:hypothetical protein ACWEN6_12125 [Sphaerisporangium sp. NPDC004334]
MRRPSEDARAHLRGDRSDLTPDGRHAFLEINPNGQFLWIEAATGLPISAAIADLLANGSS